MNNRIPLIAGNWKMYKNVAESVQTADRLNELAGGVTGVEIMIAPTFPALFPISKALQGSPISVGAQNMHWEPDGAYTGEVSGPLLKAAGAGWVVDGQRRRASQHGAKPRPSSEIGRGNGSFVTTSCSISPGTCPRASRRLPTSRAYPPSS